MRTKSLIKLIFAIAVVDLIIVGCSKILPGEIPADQTLDGPIDGLSNAQIQQFLRGDVAFNDDIFTTESGLGPIFVATSCASCHAGDGKGHPSTTLTRFGQVDETGNTYLAQGGPQLQHLALPGYEPEQIPQGATSSKFTPPANTGLGYLELVSDADILAMADVDDDDGDGISGAPNWVSKSEYIEPAENAVTQNGKYIGRFGKKSAAYNLLNQTVNAYNQDIGITSEYSPYDVYSNQEIEAELSVTTINDVVFYLQTLKAPIQRDQNDATVQNGKNVFVEIGCENCHKQTLTTSFSTIEALSYKEFHPYTDMLLHDMGSLLDDGYTEGSAKTYEWRTPPLWGLGLSKNSQGGQYYLMHDGRATTIEDAVLLHHGEAFDSKTKFETLSTADKDALMRFLESL
ncbi:MAG: di-heme oxidoredictase family protein [Chitinophagales bacterium]